MITEDIPLALWFLLGSIALLLVLVWLGQIGIGQRLRRIEARLLRADEEGDAVAISLREQKLATKAQKKLFQTYLEEDSSRRNLPKKEQFSGFRKWRAEKGLNWKGSEKTV